jgi:hypothetical protein
VQFSARMEFWLGTGIFLDFPFIGDQQELVNSREKTLSHPSFLDTCPSP